MGKNVKQKQKRIAYPLYQRLCGHVKSKLIALETIRNEYPKEEEERLWANVEKAKNDLLAFREQKKEAFITERKNKFLFATKSVLDKSEIRFELMYSPVEEKEICKLVFGCSEHNFDDGIVLHTYYRNTYTFPLRKIIGDNKVWYDNKRHGKERLVWQSSEMYIYVLPVSPFEYKSEVTEYESNDFWKQQKSAVWIDLQTAFRAKYAKRIIYEAMLPWLDKPVTNDGKPGIAVKVGYDKIKENSSVTNGNAEWQVVTES